MCLQKPASNGVGDRFLATVNFLASPNANKPTMKKRA